jgi:DNA polymerase III subunit chi
MKKAVFYLLKESSIKARDLCVCKLADKAYQNKLKTFIYTDSEETSRNVDIQLWTFRDISFLPHKIDSPKLPQPLPPIVIGHTPPPAEYNNVLINLTATIPNFVTDFSHIIEIILPNEEAQQIIAAHGAQYQQHGYEITTHNI